jgi:hypothetical protein
MDNSIHDSEAGTVEEILLFLVALAALIFMTLYWQ